MRELPVVEREVQCANIAQAGKQGRQHRGEPASHAAEHGGHDVELPLERRAAFAQISEDRFQWFQWQFAPLLFESHHVSPTYAYRDKADAESLEAYGDRLVREIEQSGFIKALQ